MKKIYTLTLTICISFFAFAQGEMNKVSEIMISAVCGGELAHHDSEKALFQYDETNHQFMMTTDLFEITYEGLENDPSKFETEEDGIPMTLVTHLDVPDLNFKTAADNGDTFQFNCEISCNTKKLVVPVTFTFFYAPVIAEKNLDGAPIHGFRLDFSFSFNPADLDLVVSHECNEVIVKVQDSLLNTNTR